MIKEVNKKQVWRAMMALAVFYVVALLMNGEALLRNAKLMPYGRYRDTMVVLVQPFAWLSQNGLGWVRERVAEERDKYWEGV